MIELAVIEQAKGVLILRYGIGSYEALAVLGHWSQQSGAPIEELARALTHGVCQGHSGTDRAQASLVRWLEQRLREDITQPVRQEAVSLRG